MIYKKITDLIGNTPLLLIPPEIHGLMHIELYAKLEYFNPFGSVKDRVAWGMVADDILAIASSHKTVIEASSGNTAKALQMICSLYGIPFKILSNRLKVAEVKDVLQLIGTEIEELPGLSECPDPTAIDGVFSRIEAIISKNPKNYFYPSQYTNEKNVQTHAVTTGPEIYYDLGIVDYLIGGLGTTGSTRGTGEFLKSKNPDCKIIGVVSSSRDFIPGIRTKDETWEVGLWRRDLYDQTITVESSHAIEACLELIRKCGVLAGPTTGAAYAGALDYLRDIDTHLTEKKKAVFIACDRAEGYISYFKKRRPDLFGDKTPQVVVSDDQIAQVNTVSVSNFDTWCQSQSHILVDIRSNMAYRVGHIEGSINIGLDFLENKIEKESIFPTGTHILFICGFGEQSRRIAAMFNQKDYQASSLEGGVAEWMRATRQLKTIVRKK